MYPQHVCRSLWVPSGAPAAIETCIWGVGGGASAPVQGTPILVLDELDSGVGGRLGQPVAQMLRRMAAPGSGAASQILCVSHLPQVRGFHLQPAGGSRHQREALLLSVMFRMPDRTAVLMHNVARRKTKQ